MNTRPGSTIKLVCTGNGTIRVGRVASETGAFHPGSMDVTHQALKAVARLLSDGKPRVVRLGDVPTYEITVRQIGVEK